MRYRFPTVPADLTREGAGRTARRARAAAKAAPFSLPETAPAPILEQMTDAARPLTAPGAGPSGTVRVSAAAGTRRRGRPRKAQAEAKVGYDPAPTVIDDPPECDESLRPDLPGATDQVGRVLKKRGSKAAARRTTTRNKTQNAREPDGRSTRKRAMPQTSADPSPTGNPAMGSRRARQRPSVGTPGEVPDRSGVRDLPERMFTPSRATEIEATPTPDYPLAHDAANHKIGNLQGVDAKNASFEDLDGEDFDLDENALNLRTVGAKNAQNGAFSAQNGNRADLTSLRLPSRSVAKGTDSPVRRRTPELPEAPLEPTPARANPFGEPAAGRGVGPGRAGTMEGQTPGAGIPGTVAAPGIVDPPDLSRLPGENDLPEPLAPQRPGDPVGRPAASGDPDDPGEEAPPRRRSRRPAPETDGEKRYYDDGQLCGWLADPDYGNAPMGNAREQFHCISIIGQIEGHCLLPEGQKATKYEHIIPTLVSVEEDDRVDGLLVILNTMGGDVEAGLAIAEMIASMTKPTVSLVLGGGHSIGVPLATAADYSLIVPSATMTIHPVRVSGMVIGVPQSFRYMSEMQERITAFICSHSKASPEDIRELMMRPDQIATDCGSILEGSEAVRYGIIDEVGGLDRALAVLREMCANRKADGNKK